jgi:hypothetical protein
MVKALGVARDATGFAETEVATEEEANAVAETHSGGDGSRPIRERSTGEVTGRRNDATGDQGRYVHTSRRTPRPHATAENASGGQTHIYPNSTAP